MCVSATFPFFTFSFKRNKNKFKKVPGMCIPATFPFSPFSFERYNDVPDLTTACVFQRLFFFARFLFNGIKKYCVRVSATTPQLR